MPVWEIAPRPLLAPSIQCFCYSERLFAPPNTSFDILPDSLIELVYLFGPPCVVSRDDQRLPLPSCFAVGLLDAPLRIAADGLVRSIRARLYPWGASALLEGSPQASSRTGMPGLLAIEGGLSALAGQLEAALAQGHERAVELLQQHLLVLALAQTTQDPVFVEAAQAIRRHKGQLSIDDLACALGISPRALRRKFHDMLGAAPKTVARTARFEHVRDQLWHKPDSPLAELALEAGYADQAHMQREFRRLSRRTPGQFAEEMRRTRLLFATDGR